MRNKITKLSAIFLIASIIFFVQTPFFDASAQINSSEIAMELTTGTVLYENNADIKLPMASTTKIMTALIIAEDCDINKEVTVPDSAIGVEGSSVYLKKGEKIDIKDLLYGLMLRSGNDCATALAIIHSGSIEKFAVKMNERARQAGAVNTNFVNPSGLPDDSHYTTARDLANIACEAMKNNIIRKIVGTKNYNGKYRNYTNKNKMLYNYEGANGVKTGYTVKAGRCLVSSAERNGMDVICVVLNCYEMYDRSSEILDYCFNNYELKELNENKVFMCNKVPCKIAINNKIVLKKGAQLNYKIIPYTENKSIKENKCEGKIQFFTSKSLIFESNLYSIVNR